MSPLALRVFFILRFIFRSLYRFHFHHILLGFTHSFTRHSPSILMFIRSFVRGNLVFSLSCWFISGFLTLVLCYITLHVIYVTSPSFQLIFLVSAHSSFLVFARPFVHFLTSILPSGVVSVLNPPHIVCLIFSKFSQPMIFIEKTATSRSRP